MSSSSGRGPGRPRKIPADEVHELVLNTARRVFGDVGFSAATIDGIARAAGVSRQAIYEHFSSKEALFDAAVRDSFAFGAEVLAAADRELDPTARDWPLRRYAVLVEFSLANPEHVRLMREAGRVGHPGMAKALQAEVESNAAGLRAYWRSQGIELDSGHSPQLIARLAGALARAMLDQRWEGPQPSAAVVAEMVTVFTSGGIDTLLKHGSAALRALG
ncbi:TetR/AcrR family transcriptional regulator [Pseudonocardia spinosispora]|uniref:TetR/AcrR family transcriptional regulator n=1 Tax=Pseudonocardia spinosispora TaxID=103441 RepID=UPI00042288F2|nr:TetR/AcrR family transcriptional regulator [Pseudonocardia spinosispora]